MTSSHRSSYPCEAVLHRDDSFDANVVRSSTVGPMRLPAINASRFVEEFNRIYKGIGLKIETLQAARESTSSEPTVEQ